MNEASEFVIEKRRGWTWRLRSPGLLDAWFDQYEEPLESSLVKSNTVRSVFKIKDDYFVKFDRPEKLLHKFRAHFHCKAESEFNTAMQLERDGIPVVKYLGWGRRGCLSMIFSQAIPDAVTALEFWTREFVAGEKKHTAYLDHLAEFLKQIIHSGYFHPDFHLGNILYSPKTRQFALVDVYGVTKPVRISVRQLERMYKIVLAFKEVVCDAEMKKLIISLGVRDNAEAARQYFYSALKTEAEFMNDEWPKRRQQILGHYRKFITEIKLEGREYLLRHTPAAEPFISPGELPGLLQSEALEKFTLPKEAALSLWLKSFRLQFYGIAHRQPLVLERAGHNNILYFRKVEYQDPEPGTPPVTEFLNRCSSCSVYPARDNLRQAVSGRILINNVASVHLET
ncbi:MAG: hypothetical protein ACYC4Q_01170 [Victivallaceae bacterium]